MHLNSDSSTVAAEASALRPVFVIGAGSVVREAHLPAYARLGVPVAGIFDLDAGRMQAACGQSGARCFGGLDALLDACSRERGVLDIAVPPHALGAVLAQVPEGSRVLLQKPLGSTLDEATALVAAARRRSLVAAVNFQLRHAPAVRALRSLVASGAIGAPLDLEVRVVCRMPWEKWAFLEGMPRMEVLMHSIHYLDLARALLGEPARVWCVTARHPAAPRMAEKRSTVAMTFGAERRAVVTTYHHHDAPPRHEASHLRIEGTDGTAVVRLGVNLDYPRGRRDTVEWSRGGGAWTEVPVDGDWFPDAFGLAMLALQRHEARSGARLESDLADAWRTMALVETCYKSADGGETVPPPPAEP
ncbi:MAG: Gfo/Idh/MocA family protein [Planctomycetota bacterium]